MPQSKESSVRLANVSRVILIGAPGCGKGTQGELLSKALGIPHVASGDLIREIVESGSQDGLRFRSLISGGNFIPDEDVIKIIDDRLGMPDAATGFVLDGYPRTLDQAKLLATSKFGAALVRGVALILPEEALVARLCGRLTCLHCGASFHEVNKPPKVQGICDNCGSDLVRRSDDEPDAIRQRLRVYHAKTEPLLEYYKQSGLLSEVDATGSPEEVFGRLSKSIGI